MNELDEKLRVAARHGSESELKLLLNLGCNALTQDKHGYTALMYAAWSGHEACVRILLQDSEALAQSNGGLTALMHAASSGHEECVQLLLLVSDALAKDYKGFTAAALSRNMGYESIAQLIDAYALAQSEKTVFDAAVQLGAPRGRAPRRV